MGLPAARRMERREADKARDGAPFADSAAAAAAVPSPTPVPEGGEQAGRVSAWPAGAS